MEALKHGDMENMKLYFRIRIWNLETDLHGPAVLEREPARQAARYPKPGSWRAQTHPHPAQIPAVFSPIQVLLCTTTRGSQHPISRALTRTRQAGRRARIASTHAGPPQTKTRPGGSRTTARRHDHHRRECECCPGSAITPSDAPELDPPTARFPRPRATTPTPTPRRQWTSRRDPAAFPFPSWEGKYTGASQAAEADDDAPDPPQRQPGDSGCAGCPSCTPSFPHQRPLSHDIRNHSSARPNRPNGSTGYSTAATARGPPVGRRCLHHPPAIRLGGSQQADNYDDVCGTAWPESDLETERGARWRIEDRRQRGAAGPQHR